jgi:hypothetical protein
LLGRKVRIAGTTYVIPPKGERGGAPHILISRVSQESGYDLASKQLSGVGSGEFGPELDGLGCLRGSQSGFDPVLQLIRGCCVGALENDYGCKPLTPFLVRKTNDSRFEDSVTGQEHVFDLCWRNVLSATDNGVIRPPLDEDIALIVYPPPVASREPPLYVEDTLAGVLPGDLLAAKIEESYGIGPENPALLISHF